MNDVFEIPVVARGETDEWTLVVTKPPRGIALTLSDGSGRTWEALGGDVFDALMRLRLDAERDGIQICCNGARRNAWSSGMQRDMGEGYAVYLLPAEKGGRPPEVGTLDPAPPDDVVSVAEQRAFFEDWSGHPPPDLPDLG
jgi:hypothetical protein